MSRCRWLLALAGVAFYFAAPSVAFLKCVSVSAVAPAATQQEPAPALRRLAPTTEPQKPFNLFDPVEAKKFRGGADSPLHRSVLAVGVTKALDGLHASRYAVTYVNRDAAAAARLFHAGYPSILLKKLRALPFADLAAEVVVVGADLLGRADADARELQAEITRLLAVS